MVGDNSHILWTAGCVLGASGVAFGYPSSLFSVKALAPWEHMR